MAITVYDVLRRPLITEKSNFQNAVLHQYAFEVAPKANKVQIKEAVETLFDVTVVKVRTLLMPAKRARRLRRMTLRSSQYKKAIVTLAEGDTIDVFEGVK